MLSETDSKVDSETSDVYCMFCWGGDHSGKLSDGLRDSGYFRYS